MDQVPVDEIYFYSHRGPFGYMSNFYALDDEFIDNEGVRFNCAEQYLMYHKAKMFDLILTTAILRETSPANIKKLGRSVKNYDDDKWAAVRYQIMVDGLRLKFGSDHNGRRKLLSTQNKMLYEASPYDNIWGIGFDAVTAVNMNKAQFGANLLGKALMQVRSELQADAGF